MAKRAGVLERLTTRRSLRHWDQRSKSVYETDFETLEEQRALAKKLKAKLDHLLFVAEDRMTLPRPESNSFQTEKGTDWAWRPDPWRATAAVKGVAGVSSGEKIAWGTTLFHDCQFNDLTVRQVRNNRESDLAPYGVRMDVFTFDGSFLSLVLDLPDEAKQNLKKDHLFRLNTVIEKERPLEIFARLNVKHGPNTEQVVREIPMAETDTWVEFDLGYTNINEKRVEKIWIDLIFEGPQMNQITMRDITVARSRRAGL